MPIIRRKDERKGFTILGKFGGGQPQPIDYSKEYFFIEDISGEENVLTISKNSSTEYVNVSVSTDKVNWVDLGSTESGDLTYTIPANGKLYVKGVNGRWATSITSSRWNSINCSKSFNVCGNIMSLLYGDDFIDKIKLPKDYTFTHLFIYSNIVDASNLILPATTLSIQFCYAYMFQSCQSLTTPPKILPATTLTYNCYQQMFYDCRSLTTAPELPATTLTNKCYQQMFYGCSKLNYIKALFTTTPNTTYTSNWVNGVARTGTFVKNVDATWDESGIHGIPTGWTIQTSL